MLSLQSGRRLLQDSNLVQPGVRLTSNVATTQQLATSVSQSIDDALKNNQIAQVLQRLHCPIMTAALLQ